MSNTIILTRESTYKQCVVRYTLFIYGTDILTSMNFSIKIFTLSKVAHIAIMCPLRLCSRLPLRKPFRFPTRIKALKSKPESSNSGKQLAYCFLHKSSLALFQPSHLYFGSGFLLLALSDDRSMTLKNYTTKTA